MVSPQFPSIPWCRPNFRPGVLMLVGESATKRRDAFLRAGPYIQHALDLEKNALPWNKFTASTARVRCRGKYQSGELFDDVIWDAAAERRNRTRGMQWERAAWGDGSACRASAGGGLTSRRHAARPERALREGNRMEWRRLAA